MQLQPQRGPTPTNIVSSCHPKPGSDQINLISVADVLLFQEGQWHVRDVAM